jgi:MFS family permease
VTTIAADLPDHSPPISGWMTFLLALSCGVIVANIYYAQPLVGPIAAELGLSPQAAGLIVTMTQLGYGAGLLLIVPLGDLIEDRRLVLSVMALGALALAIYVLAGGRHGAEAEAARKTLNHIAAGAPAVPWLQPDGTMTLEGSAGALLVTLAYEAVQLFGSEAARLVRQCQSPTCTLYFVDTSRRGDRRWCSMSACGNKAKVREFRQRKRED